MHPVLMRGHLFLPILLLAAACGGSGAPDAAREASSPAASSGTATAATGAPARLDMDAIFPSGPGRELLLNNCQNCHTFVPIVVLQMDKDAWHRNSIDHRERVTTLSDEEFKILYEYLAANFNPDRPVPELPKELLDSWTSY